MTILLITRDLDVGEILIAALARAGKQARWITSLDEAREVIEQEIQHVVVIDTVLTGFADFVDGVREGRPWVRVFLLDDPDAPAFRTGLPTLPKPFDVAELSPLLVREEESAELDRRRRTFEARAGELVERQQDLTRELEHSERLATLGRIAASMAHEINNPLAVVRSAALYMREVAEKAGDPEMLECAADLDLAVDRVGTFVQHVCGFARRERPVLTDAPLAGAIEIALRLVKPRLRNRNVQLEQNPIPTMAVPHDPPRLAQAVMNLLSNAADAASAGGGRVVLSVIDNEDHVVVRVEDDGPGLDPEIQGKLFEPFTSTKPSGQGTGLGLAITRQILIDHGGSVVLRNRPDRPGTCAELLLPRLDTSAYPVLIVDSDALVLRALSATLRSEGFPVTAVASFAEAATMATPRVAVIDSHHHDVLAGNVVQRIHSAHPKAHVLVIVDSLADTPDGAAGALTKPWSPKALVAEVRRLCIRV